MLFMGEKSFLLKRPSDEHSRPCEGLCLANVLVPRENKLRNLPFLSLKYKRNSATKTMVVECKKCLDLVNTTKECFHSDSERSFTTEFCLYELFYAITELGYK